VRTTVHWHAHGVRTLAFTPDGTILLSGGDENVLVMWQTATLHKVRNGSHRRTCELESGLTGGVCAALAQSCLLQTFLPRLGAALTSLTVSVDGTLYAIGHDDSTIRIVQATNLRLRQIIQGLKTGTRA